MIQDIPESIWWFDHQPDTHPDALTLPILNSRGKKIRRKNSQAWCGILHELQCRYLLQCDPSWAAGGQPVSPWSSPGESLLWHQVHLLPVLLSSGNLQGIFSHSYYIEFFILFLKPFSIRTHHLGWSAQLCPVVGLLEPPLSGMGQPWPILTEDSLQFSPPAFGHLHPVQSDTVLFNLWFSCQEFLQLLSDTSCYCQ